MKSKKRKFAIILMLASVLMLCFSACAENPGVAGGDFAEQGSLKDALTTDGNTTVTLTNDEAIDLTGIDIKGRKEIFIDNCTLTLTGKYALTQEGVFDIKPGEESGEGKIDLSELQFDFTSLSADYPDEMSVIEVRSGVNIIEPAENDRIDIRDFDVLKAINVKRQS